APAAIPREPRRLPPERSVRATRRSRTRWLLPLTSGSSGPAVPVRPGSRVAELQLCDCFRARWPTRRSALVEADRRSIDVCRGDRHTSMATTILIPTPLRTYTGKRDSVQVEGTTIAEALRDLTRQFSDLKQHLYTDQGALRSFVNIYVNDEDIRYLQKDA